MKIFLCSTLGLPLNLWYVKTKIIVHAFMIELDQPDY